MDPLRLAAAKRVRLQALAQIEGRRAQRARERIEQALLAYGFGANWLQPLWPAAAAAVAGCHSGDAAHRARAAAEYFDVLAQHAALAPWVAAFEKDLRSMCEHCAHCVQ
jgi:hypothetical protein